MKKYLLFLIGLFLLLPVMAQTDEGSDDAEIVEASDRKTVSESRNDSDPRIEPHTQQHEEKHRHRNENQRSGLSEEIKYAGQRLDDRPLPSSGTICWATRRTPCPP